MTLNPLPTLFDRGESAFNAIMNQSTTTTPANAQDGVQSDSPQELTSVVPTASFHTSTMSFGEVGKTFEQATLGYSGAARSVGEFGQTELLERMVLLEQVSWGVGAGIPTLFNKDVDKLLREYARNKKILDLFRFYHTDIEITMRLNTNQFYFGLLMATLYPGSATGDWLSERAVLDPTTIDASSAESVIKTWTWTWPEPWRGLNDSDITHHPVWLTVDTLVDLSATTSDLPNAITIQIWGRFKNIKLAYPSQNTELTERDLRQLVQLYGKGDDTETQSGRPKVATPSSRGSAHPAQEKNPVTELVDAVATIPMQAIDGLVGTVSGVLDTGIGSLLGGLFDKPDDQQTQTPIIIEGARDLFGADTPDSNVYIGLRKGCYVDPGPTRMPLADQWTLRKYAQIPGLRAIKNFTNAGGGFSVLDFPAVKPTTTGTELRTPLDYATKCAALSRGSIKVCLQFVASSFISARFVVQLWRTDGQHGPDGEYDYGLSRVVNVKGSTLDTFTIPWLDYTWWVENDPRQIRISLDSDIATTNVMDSSSVWLVVWIAAGEDYQFQFPRVPLPTEWQLTLPEADRTHTQAAIGRIFADKFVPMVDNVFYEEDHGFASNETVELMTDVAKRYSPMNAQGDTIVGYNPLIFDSNKMDTTLDTPTPDPQYIAWRRTLFGAMRACFMNRSGGYRYRIYRLETGNLIWNAFLPSPGARALLGTVYPHPFDSVSRLTVGQLSSRPFVMTNDNLSPQCPPVSMGLNASVLAAPLHLAYVAARDDVQFGYPILPKGIPVSPPEKQAQPDVSVLRKSTHSARKKQPS